MQTILKDTTTAKNNNSKDNKTLLLQTQQNNRPQEKNTNTNVNQYVVFSFLITYILLMTTGTITFIEALRTNNTQVRHILNIETCISIIAGYFYSTFVVKIEEYANSGNEINWANMTKTRYIDWAITTPLMLLVLCLVLGLETNIPTKLSTYSIIVALNFSMLYTGYAGEIGLLNRWTACLAGFIPFFIMFAIIYMVFIKNNKNKNKGFNTGLYWFYVVVWTMYGVVFMWSEEYKNIAMNVLDCISKCFVGIGLWAYYTKIIQL